MPAKKQLTEKKPRKPNAWIEFLKQYRLEHPELDYMQCMSEAGPLYHAQKGN
jgi:hypothetical protein